jgi:hypothetical protein
MHGRPWGDGVSRLVRDPAVHLWLLGAASLGTYAAAFVLPYSLGRWAAVPQQTIAKIAAESGHAAITYVLAFVALFVLYGAAARQARGTHRGAVWLAVLVPAVAFNATLLCLYPVDAADVFDNIIRGRMLALHGASPFYRTPAEFPGDPLYAYAAWQEFTSAYGPLWELTAAGSAWLANAWSRASPIVGHVLAFKLVGVLAYAGTAALIGLHLRRTAPECAARGVLLFAWNPLVLYVTAGNGHNDALLAFWIVLGFVCLARGRPVLAALAITAGALTKFVPALLLPVVAVAALKPLTGWRARGRSLLVTGVACCLLAAGFYAPFWRGGDPLGVGRRSGLFTTSLPSLVRWTLDPSLGPGASQALAVGMALAALAGWLAWQLLVLWRSHEETAPVSVGLSVLTFYLLVSCPWVQPWYALWLVALAPLAPDGALQRGSLLVSCAFLFKMPFLDWLIAPSGNLPARVWREWRITLATLGLPWLYWLGTLLRRRTGAEARSERPVGHGGVTDPKA